MANVIVSVGVCKCLVEIFFLLLARSVRSSLFPARSAVVRKDEIPHHDQGNAEQATHVEIDCPRVVFHQAAAQEGEGGHDVYHPAEPCGEHILFPDVLFCDLHGKAAIA